MQRNSKHSYTPVNNNSHEIVLGSHSSQKRKLDFNPQTSSKAQKRQEEFSPPMNFEPTDQLNQWHEKFQLEQHTPKIQRHYAKIPATEKLTPMCKTPNVSYSPKTMRILRRYNITLYFPVERQKTILGCSLQKYTNTNS